MLNSAVQPQHQWQKGGLTSMEFHTKTHSMELQSVIHLAKVHPQHIRKYEFKCCAAPYVGGPSVSQVLTHTTSLLRYQELMLTFARF